MSRQAVTHFRWMTCKRVFGEDHPATRAAFGRYVATLGGVLSERSSGLMALVALTRESGCPGYHNRAMRKGLRLPAASYLCTGTLAHHKT